MTRATQTLNPSEKVTWGMVGGVICFLFGLGLVARRIPQPNALHDFVQEWASGRNYLHGYPIYEPLAEAVPRHISGRYFGTVQINAHPPASVLVSLPFAFPEYATAFLAWRRADRRVVPQEPS